MEDSEAAAAAAAQKQLEDNACVKDSAENQTNDAAGEGSSNPGPACKPSEEPGTQRVRMKTFNKVMKKGTDRFVDTVSFKRFASAFGPLCKENPQRMECIHKQFIEELRKIIKEDIKESIEECQLEVKLNELDELESEAKDNQNPAWRPSGVPEQDLGGFLVPYYRKQEAYMQRELKKIKAENAALAQKVQAGRERIAQTENSISAAADEWKASVTEFERLAPSHCPADIFDV